jgi:O-acetyl-ADP-ribose deacetylase (regulator of RNase III)
MGSYTEVKGNLITMALSGEFDAITHGCNCFCTMGGGIAVPMRENFGCDKYPLEDSSKKGDIGKLGCIEWDVTHVNKDGNSYPLYVINSYTQYGFATIGSPAIDYEALTLCMRKINKAFKGFSIGIPGMIGCGLAGGDESMVREILKKELVNCKITVVYLK